MPPALAHTAKMRAWRNSSEGHNLTLELADLNEDNCVFKGGLVLAGILIE